MRNSLLQSPTVYCLAFCSQLTRSQLTRLKRSELRQWEQVVCGQSHTSAARANLQLACTGERDFRSWFGRSGSDLIKRLDPPSRSTPQRKRSYGRWETTLRGSTIAGLRMWKTTTSTAGQRAKCSSRQNATPNSASVPFAVSMGSGVLSHDTVRSSAVVWQTPPRQGWAAACVQLPIKVLQRRLVLSKIRLR